MNERFIKKTGLFQHVLTLLKEKGVFNQKLLVATSGGADSMALLHLLRQCRQIQKLKLYATFVHHGPSPDKKINQYRNKAQCFVSERAKSYNITFLSSPPSPVLLKNEAEARGFRYEQLRRRMREHGIPTLALAHNLNDVLETQLICLIRGCSKVGFQTFKTPHLRPLLNTKREDILKYLKVQQVSFLEDPSNREDHFLRNWIRLKWLPLLEKKRPGSLSAFARSLSQITEEEPEEGDNAQIISSEGLKKDLFLELSPAGKRGVLARYMRQKDCKDYSLNHINEVLKHLDRQKKNFSLKLLKKTWKISPQFILIEDEETRGKNP